MTLGRFSDSWVKLREIKKKQNTNLPQMLQIIGLQAPDANMLRTLGVNTTVFIERDSCGLLEFSQRATIITIPLMIGSPCVCHTGSSIYGRLILSLLVLMRQDPAPIKISTGKNFFIANAILFPGNYYQKVLALTEDWFLCTSSVGRCPPFLTIQRQRCIEFRVLRAQDFIHR